MNNKALRLIIFILAIHGLTVVFPQDSLLSVSKNKDLEKLLNDLNKAPDFTLTAIDDSIFNLRALEGKVVLINFWATWCGPCRMEIPEFNELYDTYHEKGLEILGISVSDNKKQLLNFTKSFSVDYPLLFGNSKTMNQIMIDYGGVYAVPSSFLIGVYGDITWKYPGAILKDYDPQTFSTLVYKIESELKKIQKKNVNVE